MCMSMNEEIVTFIIGAVIWSLAFIGFGHFMKWNVSKSLIMGWGSLVLVTILYTIYLELTIQY